MSMHQPQPLIWLARSDTSSCVDCGSGDCWITRLALANRLANLAAISLSNMLNRASMTSSSLGELHAARIVPRGVRTNMEMPATRSL